jgi:mannonate dehydratase
MEDGEMAVKSHITIEPGIKIAAQMSPEPNEEDFQFVRQMGVEYAVTWTSGANANYDYFMSRRKLFENAGIKIYGFGNGSVHNQDAIVLNLPNRDEKIEEYKRYIRALGKAGIPYTTYAHMANSVWSTDPEETRGGARARAFDLEKAQKKMTHGREYTEEEIWDNFTYFIKQAAPVAEAAGVMIGIHPDDPPGPALGGIPRCIFSNFEGYKRALEIADSPNVGICLCVGCWLEGGEQMGKDVIETIHYFGEREKIFKVHFRNVNTPLPHFVETFLDNGYMDMYKVMKALREVNFKGVVIPDHIPGMTNNHRVGTAYTIGYMKALLQRANEEVVGA